MGSLGSFRARDDTNCDGPHELVPHRERTRRDSKGGPEVAYARSLKMELDVAMYLESLITHMLRGRAKSEELLSDRRKAAHPEAVRE